MSETIRVRSIVGQIPRARAHLSLRQRRRGRSTSSPPPTGCRATSTTGWRRWCRSSRRICAPSCRRSSTCSSRTTSKGVGPRGGRELAAGSGPRPSEPVAQQPGDVHGERPAPPVSAERCRAPKGLAAAEGAAAAAWRVSQSSSASAARRALTGRGADSPSQPSRSSEAKSALRRAPSRLGRRR
jgi:hypothetical protein